MAITAWRAFLMGQMAAGLLCAGSTRAAALSVTVTPSTSLSDGQQVQVFISGAEPGSQVGLLQCLSNADPVFSPFTSPCSFPNFVTLTADANGAAQTSFTVNETISTLGGASLSCKGPGTCAVAAFPSSPGDGILRFQPISFQYAYATPNITVVPNTQLSGGQVVAIAGGGFEPRIGLELKQCHPNASDFDADCVGIGTVAADDAGSIATTVAVLDRVNTDPVSFSCEELGSCALIAAPFHGFEFSARATLGFRDLEPPHAGTLSVTPNPVPAYATVLVEGASWAPFADLQVGLCPAGSVTCGGEMQRLNVTGTFARSLVATGLFRASRGRMASFYDCTSAPGACVVDALDNRDAASRVVVPLTIRAPNVSAGAARLDTRLPLQGATSTVRLHGYGWSRKTSLLIMQCPASSFSSCLVLPSVVTNCAGSFSTFATLERNVLPVPGEGASPGLDCSMASACRLVIADERALTKTAYSIPLTFQTG